MKKIILIALLIFSIQSVMAVSIVSYNFDTSSGASYIYPDIILDKSVSMEIRTDRIVNCKYSSNSGASYESMEGTFDFNFGTLHKKSFTDLNDGSYKYFIACRNSTDTSSSKLEITFNIITPVTAQISLSDDSPIGAGLFEISLITSKPVQQSPSLTYSFNGISYDPIPLSGSGTDWNGYLIIDDSAGETASSFKFSAKDINGNTGTEITSGSIFIVDTIKPRTILDFDATGFNGRTELEWHEDDDEIDFYRIYKSESPNVEYSDFYKEVSREDDSYSDTSVEKGKTYYYRISAVDEAGNEGELSVEAYATALFENSITSPTGLSINLQGLVDNSLSGVDLVMDDVKSIENSFNSKDGAEADIIESLEFGKELAGVKSELSSLRKDVEKYKQQSLTRAELDSKLQSVELRLNTIKKKVPESISIVSEKEASLPTNPEELEKVFLQINPDTTDSEKRIKKSIESMENLELESSVNAYNLDIIYLDGSRREKSLIKAFNKLNSREDNNLSIVHFVPKEIVNSIGEMDIKNPGYSVIKDDPIISFSLDTEEITYIVDGHFDLNNIDNIRTLLLYKDIPQEQNFPITGYFSFVDSGKGGYFGLILAIMILFGFGIYFYFIRKGFSDINNGSLSEILDDISGARSSIREGDIDSAKKIYQSLSDEYSSLEKKYKKKVYSLLIELNDDLHEAHLRSKFNNANEASIEEAKEIFFEIDKVLETSSQKIKEKFKAKHSKLSRRVNDGK